MPARDPYKFESMARGLRTMNAQFKATTRPSFIQFTQGGSSRPNHPAKVAGSNGNWRPWKEKKRSNG